MLSLAENVSQHPEFIVLSSCFVALARYFVLSGVVHWHFRDRTRQRLISHAVTFEGPRREQVVTEIKWGVLSCIIMGCIGGVMTILAFGETTQVYSDIGVRGWGYAVVSFFILVFSHDLYFYGTHYILHRWKFLYRTVHYVHHCSKHPSPFADLAFHPVETVIQAAFIPAMMFAVPLHPLVIGVYLVFVSSMNVIGHTGFEIFPFVVGRRAAAFGISTTGNHALHHLFPDKNFGLYLSIWDRWLGTGRPYFSFKKQSLDKTCALDATQAHANQSLDLPNAEYSFNDYAG